MNEHWKLVSAIGQRTVLASLTFWEKLFYTVLAFSADEVSGLSIYFGGY